MKQAVLALTLLAFPCFAAEHVLIPLKKADSAVLILDHEGPNHARPEVVIAPAQSPGRVIVEKRMNPDPKDWTEVRWVFRFDLAKAPAVFTQAKLHLWCQSAAGSPKVMPTLDVIAPGDPHKIVAADRASKPIGPRALEILFPSNPQMIEMDVTTMVQEALKQKMAYAAFRISAMCDKAECEGDAPQSYYFGGFTNVWQWSQSEPPLLEITP